MSKTSSRRYRHVADEILEKAAALFDERGYGLVSLQDVADAVGIARPSLYHYFESKEEILATLVERATLAREEILEFVSAMEGSPEDRLRVLLRRVGASTASNPAGLRLTLDNDAALPAETRRRSARSRRVLFELLVEILAEGVDSGALRPMNESEVAATIIAALTGLQYRGIGGIDIGPEQAAEQLEQLLVLGIRQPAERRAANLEQAIALLHQDLEIVERHARPAESRLAQSGTGRLATPRRA